MNSAYLSDITPTKPKVPLKEAAGLVEELTHRIADGQDLDAAFQQVFGDALADIASAVSRRKAVRSDCAYRIMQRKAEIERLQNEINQYRAIDDRIVDTTQRIMAEHPDLPFKDAFGRKLTLVENQGRLVVDIDLGQKVVSGILDQKDIDENNIPSRFWEPAVFFVLKKPDVKAALEAGERLPWARIEKGHHVRGWNS